MAGRRAVPGLSTLVRGLQQRRNRRSAGSSYAPGSSGVARRRRHLAQPDDAVAERRLGLRRGRLLRGAPGSGHARRPRRPGRRRRVSRHPRAARSGAQPHQRSPLVVRGCAYRSERGAPRLLRLGRSGAGRRRAEQLALRVRRPGVDVARADRPVLPQPVPADPARPELVERRRARSVRRDPALLVRPRRVRLPHRRLPRDRQGPRAARRPRRDRRRPPAHLRVRAAARVLDEPPGAARGLAALAPRDDRRADPRRRDLRARARAADPVLRHRRGRAAPRVQLPVRARGSRRGADAAARRGDRGQAARGGVAGVDRLQPRCRPAGDPLGRRRRAQGARGAADAADAARHAGPLLRRRDRAAGRRARLAGGARPGRAPHREP